MSKEDLTKLCLLRRLIIKLMQENAKVWKHAMQENIFKILQKIQNLLFNVKISFLQLHFYNYTFSLQSQDGMVVHRAAQLHYE